MITNLSPAEKKASELANQIAKPVLRSMVSRGEANEMCMKMAKAIFDLAEVKGMVDAIDNFKKQVDAHGGNYLPGNYIQMEKALTAWRSFRGET